MNPATQPKYSLAYPPDFINLLTHENPSAHPLCRTGDLRPSPCRLDLGLPQQNLNVLACLRGTPKLLPANRRVASLIHPLTSTARTSL